MRTLLATAVLLAAAPSASAATLLGSVDGGPLRILDANLRAVPGKPALPAGVDGTVLSPSGRRVATWGFSGGTLTLRSRRTFARQRTLKVDTFPQVDWPTRNHIVTTSTSPETGVRVRSYDLARGTVRTHRYTGVIRDQERAGKRVRVLRQTAGDWSFPAGELVVEEFGAAGALKREWTVPATPDAGAWLSDGIVLASRNDEHALIGVGGSRHAIDLPGGYWEWAGRDFLFDNGRIAKVDRSALAVTRTIDVGIPGTVTPYRGGVVIGFGRERYDASLERVAENPSPADTQGGPLVFADRLYDLLYDCESPAGIAIADARTGAPIRQRPGEWTYGVLGRGYLHGSASEDICD